MALLIPGTPQVSLSCSRAQNQCCGNSELDKMHVALVGDTLNRPLNCGHHEAGTPSVLFTAASPVGQWAAWHTVAAPEILSG